MGKKFLDEVGLGSLRDWILGKLGLKQDTLVSGTNIKTINNNSLLGSGNLNIEGGSSDVFIAKYGVTPPGDIITAFDSGKAVYIKSLYNDYAMPVIATREDDEGWYQAGLIAISPQNISEYEQSPELYQALYKVDPETDEYVWDREFKTKRFITTADVSSQLNDGMEAVVEGGTIKSYVDAAVTNLRSQIPGVATDAVSGTVKLNPSESITLNAQGQLDVGGRLGQMSNTTGLYSPKTINPTAVGNGSLLITEGTGTTLGNKSFAVSTGTGITLKTSAAAGATQYVVSNTYENRIICAGLVGGRLAINETSAGTRTVAVSSVQINGSSYTPSSTGNITGDIIITTAESVNPDSSVSQVRGYCLEQGFSDIYFGQLAGSENAGASVIGGQKVFSKSGNACVIVGASIYNTGNGNAIFGRQHISRKNRSLLAGTGHDTTNAASESVVAVGAWSDIDANTLFAVGDGTSATDRHNAFEVRQNEEAYVHGKQLASEEYVDSKVPTATTATLSSSGWDANLEQTVNVTGVTASNVVIAGPAPANLEDYTAAGVYCNAQGSGTLTFKCKTVPTSALTVNVVIM